MKKSWCKTGMKEGAIIGGNKLHDFEMWAGTMATTNKTAPKVPRQVTPDTQWDDTMVLYKEEWLWTNGKWKKCKIFCLRQC